MNNEDYKKATKDAYDKNVEYYTEYISSNVDFTKRTDIDLFLKNVLGSKILDMGCGDGVITKHFQDLGFEVTGIDNSKSMIKACMALGLKDLHVMDLEDLFFPKDTFDAIWACSSLHHIPKEDIALVLEKIHTITKKGGTIFISLKQPGSDGMKTKGFPLARFFASWDKDEFLNKCTPFFDLLEVREFNKGNKVPRIMFLFKNK